MKRLLLILGALASMGAFLVFWSTPFPETTLIYNGEVITDHTLFGLSIPMATGLAFAGLLLVALLVFLAGFSLMLFFWLAIALFIGLAFLFPFLWIMLIPMLLFGGFLRKPASDDG